MTLLRHIPWLSLLAALAIGCSENATPTTTVTPTVQVIRVRLRQGVSQVEIAATSNPRLVTPTMQRDLLFPQHGGIIVTRVPGGWRIGGAQIVGDAIAFWPQAGVLSVDKSPYRGSLRFVPVSEDGSFDVINDLPIDDYLKGVLASELYRNWDIQAYKAQAVVARTYALYHAHLDGVGRYWDVYPDERSQMYGGMAAETAKSDKAATETAGLVLTYGPGEGRIFEAYFSSDSGGVTQSAADAFPGGPDIPPLQSHPEPNSDLLSPYRNWGPITISKAELTRRLQIWAARRSPPRPEISVTAIDKVELAALNPYGRPRAFRITDATGNVYVITAEEMRAVFNTDAPSGQGNTLPSSFCKVGTSDTSVVFFDGHGYGHGVGMCQWCAQQQAAAGETYDQIVLAAYPQARLARAY